MNKSIIINEAEAIRDEPRQMMVGAQQISCLAVVMASSEKTLRIKEGSIVEFKGREYLVHQKEVPDNRNSPIVYLILIDTNGTNPGKKGGKIRGIKN